MLDKETLNTYIIKLRPCVRQAKVHLIHQLTKNVSKWKKKYSKDEREKEKNNRKISRCVEEIKILRNEDKDVVAKWVLVNKRTLDDVSKEETLSQKFDMRIRAFVRISEHKAVSKVVNEVRSISPNWEKEMPKILKSLGKSKKRRKDPNAEPIGGPPMKVKREDDKESITNDTLSSPTKSSVEKESNSEEIEEDEKSSEDEGDECLFVNSLKSCLKQNSDGESLSGKSEKTDDESDETDSESDGEQGPGEKLVTVLDLKSDNIPNALITAEDDKSKEMSSPLPKKKSSSFFLGGESSTESEADESDPEAGENEEDFIESHRNAHHKKRFGTDYKGARGRGRISSSNRGRGQTNFRGSGFKKHGQSKFSDSKKFLDKKSKPPFPEIGEKKTPFVNTKNFSKPPLQSQPKKEVDASLHPSWVAKQKAKPSIAAFQGKKTVFED